MDIIPRIIKGGPYNDVFYGRVEEPIIRETDAAYHKRIRAIASQRIEKTLIKDLEHQAIQRVLREAGIDRIWKTGDTVCFDIVGSCTVNGDDGPINKTVIKKWMVTVGGFTQDAFDPNEVYAILGGLKKKRPAVMKPHFVLTASCK
jgi:hypothetical protein